MLAFIIHGLCFFSFCFLLTTRWGVLNQQVLLKDDLNQASLYNCVKMQPFAISLGLIAIVDDLPMVAILAFSLPLVALFIPVYVGMSKESSFVAERHWLHVNRARLHFIHTDKAMCCDAFYEVLALLLLLKKEGVQEVSVSSPLFLKNHQIREFPYLISQLNRKGIVAHSYSTPWCHFPLMIATSCYLKYVKRAPQLKGVSLFQWRTFILYL